MDSIKTKESKSRLLSILNLPIAGITYEQVLAFCSWRVELDHIRHQRNYNFRLPSPSEFDLINPFQDSVINRKHASALFNYRDASYLNKKGGYYKDLELCGKSTLWVYTFCSHIKNKTTRQFFYNVRRNVAEMSSIKGIAKGGSYAHSAIESLATINNRYTQPELWLGFRCFVERKK
jgi:hypothetical protein